MTKYWKEDYDLGKVSVVRYDLEEKGARLEEFVKKAIK